MTSFSSCCCNRFNPTSLECVHQALEMLQITKNDILYDLGCGDGRLLVEVMMTLMTLTYSHFLLIIYNIIGIKVIWNKGSGD